jgi:SAM-dependent methyltransferase
LDLVEARGLTRDRHPWELARAAFFNREVLKAVGDGPARVLDVGCGDGWFARRLLDRMAPSSTAIGWDVGLTGERIGVFSEGLPPGMELTADEPEGPFDLVLCMDVIEHVADDEGFLTGLCRRSLRPGGLLLCSVPAWPSLFSKHDVELRHFRRYTPETAARVLASSGLVVRRKGGLFHGLAAVRGFQVALRGRARPLDDPRSAPEPEGTVGVSGWSAPAPVTGLVAGLLAAEGLLSRAAASLGVELPGLSWWALCERPA